MDKLRPILTQLAEQKFWVLSIVSLLMIITGWWMGTGNLNAQFEERKSILDQLRPESGHSANSNWVQIMEKHVKVKQDYLGESALYLHSRQKSDKTKNWPSAMLAMMKDKPYYDDIPVSGLEVYRRQYQNALIKMRRIAHSFDSETGRGRCSVDIGILPQVSAGIWDQTPPSSAEVWNAQMDIWLVSALLQAVSDTNAGTKGIIEAPIKLIDTLELHGGNRNSIGTPATAGNYQNNGGGATEDAEMGVMGDVGLGGGGRGSRKGGKRSRKGKSGDGSVGFSISEEIGSPKFSKLQSQQAKQKGITLGEKRYVDDDPKMPLKTRGFYLKVVMDRNKLPDFLVQLTNLKYPVEIVRVHQASLGGGASKKGSKKEEDEINGINSNARRPDLFNNSPMGNAKNPMGRSNPMGTPMGKGFRPPKTIKRTSEQEKAAEAYDRAMRDPHLSEIVIGGLMTIYTPVEQDSPAKPEPKQ